MAGQTIQRSPKVHFRTNLYGTKYKINVQGNYAVERLAAQKKPSPYDPFIGLSKLKLEGKIGLDIGANVGTVSIGLAALNCKRVYSIELGPLHERLLNNIELNNLHGIVLPYKVGLGEGKRVFWRKTKIILVMRTLSTVLMN